MAWCDGQFDVVVGGESYDIDSTFTLKINKWLINFFTLGSDSETEDSIVQAELPERKGMKLKSTVKKACKNHLFI